MVQLYGKGCNCVHTKFSFALDSWYTNVCANVADKVDASQDTLYALA